MNTFAEHILFALTFFAVAREIFMPRQPRSRWYCRFPDVLDTQPTWHTHIHKSRRAGTLGALRVEQRAGQLCVVGMGQHRTVRSMEEGVRMIEGIQHGIANLFD